ncbi:hypothetical protein MLD38_018252 [Melastoma candidum]|uniref:Uncharacterized protein n=1 Tax=Melastoma candidum TaxID=119954 RepID=A0ACB9QV57_9MYRT|nr:hypothetical protein MLD38_018252 [Melastoma candidum]
MPAISTSPRSFFYLAKCTGVDHQQHLVQCETLTDGLETLEPWKFNVAYDKLVGLLYKGIVCYLGICRSEVVLQGVEFSGELSDFITKDVRKRYSHSEGTTFIHSYRGNIANEILSSFDDRLRQYATNQLTKSGVRLVRGIVKDVKPQKLILTDGSEVPYGFVSMVYWSRTLAACEISTSSEIPWREVTAVGLSRLPGSLSLPALAQVAERQGKYLAKLLNDIGKADRGHADSLKDFDFGDPFVYKHLGSMATIGRYKALVDLRQSKDQKGIALAGFTSWFIWRSAYLTRVISWRNRFYVAINWFTTLVCRSRHQPDLKTLQLAASKSRHQTDLKTL